MASRQNLRENADLMLAIFAAIEQRDARRFTELVHPDFEIQWPPSLPYGGTYPDLDSAARQGRPDWAETWNPLQPTAAERRMDPRIVAANDQGEVVVLWRQRGRTPAGQRFDGQVLGLYQVREGRLARARMFYFDTAALAAFLAEVGSDKTRPLSDRERDARRERSRSPLRR